MKTILFAAGASIPYFDPILSTKSITDAVTSDKEWDAILNEYRRRYPEHSIVDPRSVINNVISFRPDINFEQLAEIIDKISSLNFDAMPTNNMFNAIFFSLGIKVTANAGWKNIPFLYREIIARHILNIQQNHKADQYNNLLKLQHDFIEYVANSSDKCSVVSTNYDDLVPLSLAGIGFENCFNNIQGLRLTQLNVERFMRADRVVYYPHGHLRFNFVDNNNVTYCRDSSTADDERWAGLNSSSIAATTVLTNGKFAYNFNTFLCTGQTKDDSLNQLPYAVYYQRMAIDFNLSDTIYIIGYSFGDSHINRLLKSFMSQNGKKIFIIDYIDPSIEVTMTHEYRDSNNILLKIHETFNTDWRLFVDNHTNLLKPYNQTAVDDLNNKGYGEIFDNVILYRKGYDDFLKEFQLVI